MTMNETNSACTTKSSMDLEKPVTHTAWTRCSRVNGVCLRLLCILLLSATTVVHGSLEGDELQAANNNPDTEKDQLKQLQTIYNSLKIERDQLQARYNNVTSERDQLKASYDSLVIKKDLLQTTYDTLITEKEQLQITYTSLTEERDQLQTSYNNLKTEKDQLEDKIKQVTDEKEKLEASNTVMRTQLDQFLKEKDGLQERLTGNFKVGDWVRVKASVSTPKYKWGDASHKSVGVVTAVNSDSMTVDFPDHKSWKADTSEMELVPTAASGCFRIGDRVKVKASVSTPKHGWGDASHKSVGVITALNGERMIVDFPEHKSWTAIVSEMEMASSADSGYFRVGDRVRVKASVSTPKFEWGKASHKSVGVVTAVIGERMLVDFPEHKTWRAEISEMELAPSVDTEYFRVGDRVRVKPSVSTPKYEWGEVSHKSVGVVTAIDGEKMLVDFPEHKSWKAATSEMELTPSYSGYFRAGDRVKVKAFVSTPKYEWGEASHKSVGVVTAVDGEKMLVDFPEHKSWKADTSEMELVLSADTDLCKFKFGDRVQVKSSVETPKYGWGLIGHKDVGTIKAFKVMVDFPEHSSWTGDPSELELTS